VTYERSAKFDQSFCASSRLARAPLKRRIDTIHITVRTSSFAERTSKKTVRRKTHLKRASSISQKQSEQFCAERFVMSNKREKKIKAVDHSHCRR
jgi:hypothetical protein